jgi:hypothetical protein
MEKSSYRHEVVVGTISQFTISDQDLFLLCETVSELEALEYTRPYSRKPRVLFELIKKNPNHFIVAMHGPRLVGYCDFWQLTTGFYASLLTGESAEEEICAAYVLSADESPTKCWYFGSIIIDEKYRSDTALSRGRTSVAWQIMEIIRAFFDDAPDNTRILAVGSTDFGKHVLVKNYFQPVNKSPNAKDHRPRYQKVIEVLAIDSSF